MTIDQIRKWALSLDSPYLQQRDIDILLNYVQNNNDGSIEDGFKTLAQRRLQGEPLAYIIKTISFWDYNFFVDNRVLKPRIETEQIVAYLTPISSQLNKTDVRIIDMGCGCGAIGISVANLFNKASLTLADISVEALEVCQINANLVSQHPYQIIQSDLWDSIPNQQFDIIVANLPYLNTKIGWDHSTNFEPHIALDGGGQDGLSLYRRFIQGLKVHSHIDTHLIIESDRWQQPALEEMLSLVGYQLQWQDYFISAFLAT